MKQFWKTYIGDRDRLRFMLSCLFWMVVGMALIFLVTGTSLKFVLPPVCGVVFCDPLSYYLVEYRRRKKLNDNEN